MTDSRVLQIALEEARHSYRLVLESSDALEAKGRALLGSASLIIAIFTAFELNSLVANPLSFRGVASMLVLAAYLWLVRDTASAIRPIEISMPIVPRKDEYEKQFRDKTEPHVLKMMFGSYIRSTNKIIPHVDKRARTIDRAVKLLVAIVVVLIATPFLPA